MDINTNAIGGISIESWKKAFGKAVAITMENDEFSDILFCELYPNTDEEVSRAEEVFRAEGKDEKEIYNIYGEKWNYANEAFKAVFGFDRYGRE